MDAREIVRLLADADAGRATGPIRPGGFAVVAYDGEADFDEEDEDYDEDLKHLVVWGIASTAAEAFDLLGDTLADRFGDAVDDQVEHALGRGVRVNDFDQWFEGYEGAIALLKAKPTDGRKMLMFLLYGYYAPMEYFDARSQPYHHYLDTAAKLFTGAKILYGASAVPPWHDEAIGVFELQPTNREEGPNSLDDRGMSPLHHAVARDDLAAVTALLESGADPNLQSDYGNSPLFAAVDHRGRTSSALETIARTRWALTRALLDHGAQINSRDRLGRNIVDLAVSTLPYPAEILGELRSRGGKSFRYKSNALEQRLEQRHPRAEEAFHRHLGEIRYLLETRTERRGLLHKIFESGYSSRELPEDRLAALVELLLAHGVRDEAIDGRTAADLARKWVACGSDHYQTAIDLIEASADQWP